MLKMYKLKNSVSLQQALDKNLLSSFGGPLGSTLFLSAHCAIKNWNSNLIIQANTKASVEGHLISLLSVAMASSQICFTGALPYCAGVKVPYRYMVCSFQRPEKTKSCYFWNTKNINWKAVFGSCSSFLKDSCKWYLLHTNKPAMMTKKATNKQVNNNAYKKVLCCQENPLFLISIIIA